jgi:hypothetical protein
MLGNPQGVRCSQNKFPLSQNWAGTYFKNMLLLSWYPAEKCIHWYTYQTHIKLNKMFNTQNLTDVQVL